MIHSLISHLNVKFDEVDGGLGGSIEGEEGVLLDGLHPPVGRLQHVHAVAPVPHHQKLLRQLVHLPVRPAILRT